MSLEIRPLTGDTWDALVALFEHARTRGAHALDAYPVRLPSTDTGEALAVHPGAAFTGTSPMFEGAGFRVVADRAPDASSSNQRVVVRLELSGAAVAG